MFVDSHCHLNFPELFRNLSSIRASMVKAQVDRALVISTKLETFDTVHQLAIDYDNFWCTIGVHPDEEDVQEPTLLDLTDRAKRARVIGIGETGLDYYRIGERTYEKMEWQRNRFRIHIQAAQATRLPLVIHTRSASADTLSILKEEGEDGSTNSAGGVFHCFTETMDVAKAALDLGFYISFSGIVTFKNAKDLQEVARFVPMDRMLIETDSPYLAPTPHRGKTNTPALVPWVAHQLAILKNTAVEEIGHQTTQNFNTLFKPQ
ncbi:MAG: TatD family deoxyribonuclease [Limnohabitans sp.]|nr:TatD family deoxyribonuclease [Limnohabitans sp.]